MKDHLLDIVQHTHGLGNITMLKIVGTENETKVHTSSDDRSVVVEAKFAGPIAEFIGTFGMPNLNKLNTILNISEYKEDAKFEMITKDQDGNKVPVGIHFENKSGDFKNDYRFMTSEVVNEKLKTLKFKGVKWDVEIEPSVQGIQRLKFQASANNEENTFMAKTDGGNLKFYFGDHSSHAGNFVFAPGVSGTLSKSWGWPVAAIINILSLPGDKRMRFSDEGAAQITVNSGIAEWTYTLPGQVK